MGGGGEGGGEWWGGDGEGTYIRMNYGGESCGVCMGRVSLWYSIPGTNFFKFFKTCLPSLRIASVIFPKMPGAWCHSTSLPLPPGRISNWGRAGKKKAGLSSRARVLQVTRARCYSCAHGKRKEELLNPDLDAAR